jgi:uncharacterized phage protein (TIGR01671 family)
MNRELKFRLWDKEDNSWHNPNILEVWNDSGQLEPFRYVKTGKLDPIYMPLENWTIQQYTGLKDKNDKEIYEGDIISTYVDDDVIPELKSHKYTLLVYFSNRTHQWCGKTKNVDEYQCESFPFYGNQYEILLNKTEIIGNIFENPDLLK